MALSKLEIRRQMFHLVCGLVIILGVYFNVLGIYFLLGVLVAGIVISLISRTRKLPVIHWFLENFDRKEDLKRFPGRGAIFELAGMCLALFLFPGDIALAAIAVLVVGDSIGPLIGQYGKIKHPFNQLKCIEGHIAAVAASFLVCLIFVSPLEAFLAPLIAMTFEVIEWELHKRLLDDNITVPLIAGAVIVVMRLL